MNELSRDARRLIHEVAHADGPSAARRARVKEQLAVRLAASGVVLGAAKLAAAASGQAGGNAGALLATAAASKVGGVGLGSVALCLAGGALVGTLTMAPLVMTSESAPPASVRAPKPAAAARATTARGLAASPGVGALPTEPEAQTGAVEPEHGVEHERAPSRESGGAAARAVTTLESAPASERAARNLGAETELLEAAQRELAAGQGERALQLLEHHEQRFPSAALSEERTFARVIALCQLGRSAEARTTAEAFLRAAPRSPLLPRLRKSCAFSEGQSK